MEWTKEQSLAINKRGGKILVAAGAGSGKTAVLVERIIKMVIDEKIDIDKLLIVTFTNAAASEMRERISEALYDNLEKHPELRNQILLLNRASIMTIDSFCNKVLRDNFYKLDLDPNFKVADSSENELLKLEALDEVIEELYEEEPEIIDIYSSNKSDDSFRAIVLRVHNFIQSNPFPYNWLEEKCEMYNINEDDFGQTIWGKELIRYARNEILGSIEELENLAESIENDSTATNYYLTLQDDILMLKALRINNTTWNDFYEDISKIKFISLKRAPKLDPMIADEVKEIRNKVKDKIQGDLRDNIFISNSQEIFKDISYLYKNLKKISDIVIRFDKKFKEKKHEKNLIDFSDMEHLCLNLLNEDSNICDLYKNQYEEILIDEYQDSNLIQEFILNLISNGNIFMVGDVKQSIYKFRQARPELFLEKYNTYTDGKILLFDNFRSNKNIIDQCNFIFSHTMSKDVGDIDYDEKEYLKFGANYYPFEGEEAEIHLIDKGPKEDDDYDESLDDIEDKPQLEAKVVCQRIKEMVGNFDVYDKKLKQVRKANYGDFAILFRATKNYVEHFITELSNSNIPVFADSNSGYFDNMEVQVILALLKVIDNPFQDIPLIAVLRSKIGDFDVNELTDIRLVDKNCSYFEAMQKAAAQGNSKAFDFLNKLSKWREKSKHMALGEFIWSLYVDTDYYNYVSVMPNGNIRKKNLDILLNKAELFDNTSYRGLFNFINYIDNLKESSGDLIAAKLIGEGENVVRIMSIHKSKGLEFPIVFLCGTSRLFNRKDERDEVILHQDYGFGADIINLNNRIVYESVPKIAIKQKMKEEALSEELRILYVALTRAREKLIITSLVRDVDKDILKWSSPQTEYKVANAKCFADWICGTVLSRENNWTIRKWSYSDVIKLNQEISDDSYKVLVDNIENNFKINELYQEIDNTFKWKYKYNYSTKLPAKYTVSELKYYDEDNSKDLMEIHNTAQMKINDMPSFMNESQKISGAEFGTILHNIMQRVNFMNFDIDSLLLNVDDSYKDRLKKYLKKFSETELCKEIQSAKKVYKEMPFNLSVKLKDIYGDEISDDSANDDVLIQGVIDLYFIDNNNEIVLVDYKTDYIKTEEGFVSRYKTQLDYYKKALEILTKHKVRKVIIYSFNLNKEILI